MKLGIKHAAIGLVASILLPLSFSTTINAATKVNNFDQRSQFVTAYNEGREKSIITTSDYTKNEFIKLCKDAVFPAYLHFSKNHPTVSFAEYIAEDNYEVPQKQAGDHPTTVRGNDDNLKTTPSSTFIKIVSARMGRRIKASDFTEHPIRARSGYHMKAGDILVCYGWWGINNSIPNWPGHVAIATSSRYILEMPGTEKGHRSRHHNARTISKARFFRNHTKGKTNYVIVYRPEKHLHEADKASTYAYRHMYKRDNPYYSIIRGLFVYKKSPSYCSKYVYYAYWAGAKHSAVKRLARIWPIQPHHMRNYFRYHLYYLHKITKY